MKTIQKRIKNTRKCITTKVHVKFDTFSLSTSIWKKHKHTHIHTVNEQTNVFVSITAHLEFVFGILSFHFWLLHLHFSILPDRQPFSVLFFIFNATKAIQTRIAMSSQSRTFDLTEIQSLCRVEMERKTRTNKHFFNVNLCFIYFPFFFFHFYLHIHFRFLPYCIQSIFGVSTFSVRCYQFDTFQWPKVGRNESRK